MSSPAPTGCPCPGNHNFSLLLGCTWVEADGFCSFGEGFWQKTTRQRLSCVPEHTKQCPLQCQFILVLDYKVSAVPILWSLWCSHMRQQHLGAFEWKSQPRVASNTQIPQQCLLPLTYTAASTIELLSFVKWICLIVPGVSLFRSTGNCIYTGQVFVFCAENNSFYLIWIIYFPLKNTECTGSFTSLASQNGSCQ